MRCNRRHLALAAVAILGIATPAALTWSITRLTGQHIGLAAQPLSVIKGLAPARRDGPAWEEGAVRTHGRARPGRHRQSETRRSAGTSSAPATTLGTSSTSSSPSILSSPTGSVPAAPASAAQTPAASPGTRGRTSGGHGGDDSSGSGSSGPDD